MWIIDPRIGLITVVVGDDQLTGKPSTDKLMLRGMRRAHLQNPKILRPSLADTPITAARKDLAYSVRNWLKVGPLNLRDPVGETETNTKRPNCNRSERPVSVSFPPPWSSHSEGTSPPVPTLRFSPLGPPRRSTTASRSRTSSPRGVRIPQPERSPTCRA
jgi:hypothetical protein